jgi:hypothetical protein
MLTYQARPRVFQHQPGENLEFPAQGEFVLHFRPSQPFGVTPGGGRTIVRGAEASVLFNMNSGHHEVTSNPPLSPLDVTLKEPSRTARLLGTELSVSQHFDSLDELELTISGVYFLLPFLLNLSFADPPYVERVDGTVGGRSFRWELLQWNMNFQITTQDDQEGYVAKAWTRLGVVADPEQRRLAAALHSFHVACRLAIAGSTPGEFLAEVILNLAKSLEVLFPASGDGRKRDAARDALRTLGFTEQQIECDFIPAIALRNEIDVGHVELGLFSTEQLTIIHAFTDRALYAFREMFDRILNRTESGEFQIKGHDLKPSRQAIGLIERLKNCPLRAMGYRPAAVDPA